MIGHTGSKQPISCSEYNRNVPGYDTVLFDSDGVLVSPPAHETQLEATRAAFQAVGIEDADQQHLIDIVNGVTVDRLHEICTVYDLDPEVFWEARERHDEQSQLDRFKNGSRDCYTDVTAISNLSQNCGVVSNNHHSTIGFVLDFFGLQPLFDTYYGREKTIESLDLKNRIRIISNERLLIWTPSQHFTLAIVKVMW
jgi:phosphoglycolate phosphatase